MRGRRRGCDDDDEVASGISVIARDPEVARLQMFEHVPGSIVAGPPRRERSLFVA